MENCDEEAIHSSYHQVACFTDLCGSLVYVFNCIFNQHVNNRSTRLIEAFYTVTALPPYFDSLIKSGEEKRNVL